MSISPDMLALAVSGAALLISILAFGVARSARLLALRTEVRSDFGSALADARKLVDKAVVLTEETMQAAYDLRTADGSGFKPDEREAFDLKNEARGPLEELEQLGVDVGRKSRRHLEATCKEIARVRRLIADIDTKIEIKRAALDRLRGTPQMSNDAPDRNMVFRSRSPEAKAGEEGA